MLSLSYQQTDRPTDRLTRVKQYAPDLSMLGHRNGPRSVCACRTLHYTIPAFNPLPDILILGSSNSAANKDRRSKMWTNGDTII